MLILVFGAQPGVDAKAEVKRNAVRPAELRVGHQAERFERRAQLHGGTFRQVIADIGAVDGVFAPILKPESAIEKCIVYLAGGIDAKSVKA